MITIKCDCCGKKIRRNGAKDSYWQLKLEVDRYEGSDNKDEEGLELADSTRELDICNDCVEKAKKNKETSRPRNVRMILDGAIRLGLFDMEPETIETEEEEE